MLNYKHSLTPIALAVAMASGAAHAAEPPNGRLAGAVNQVAGALTAGADRDARIEQRGSADRTQAFAQRGSDDRAQAATFDRDNDREQGSLLGLAAADRRSLRDAADERRTNDPQGLGFELNLGNTSDSNDARGAGIKVSHDSTLHLGTEEDADSPLDDSDETKRSGLASATSVHLTGSRQQNDGDRERIANGIETNAQLFNHAPHERGEGESYRTAELAGFATQRTVEEGVIGDDEDASRSGAALKYDSREGFSVERGNDDR